ncbi:membrane protein of unknown function [Modestobacter italicus]|uniref:Uncharacterized protein n=1 Tax=Modestobacter italicus (strain DSM 44449 / CECT 9708 / BC 501) TaxID=2732864 RepID=I4EX00_MODI5|nr:hypothetical protein [Modestobacter marinus]CCH87913.1 membrane protein of unknown function [Modestobacter marinus]
MAPTETPDPRAGLLDTIRARRVGIEAYVRRKAPVSRRLSTVSILSSAVIVALMAGPALGGPTFAERVQDGLSLDASQPVWQVLCSAALVVSMTAAVSAHLEKTSDLRARVGAAEAAGVMLAGLQARLEYGGLPVQEAAQEYRDVLAGIPFVPEAQGGTTSPAGRREHGPAVQLTVVVLAALLLAVTFVGLFRGAAAEPGGEDTGAAPTASEVPAPTPAPSPGPTSATPSPPAAATQGVFGGETRDGGASLAIVIDADRAMAYVCDGRQFEAWLTGSVVDGRLQLSSPSGASLTGAFGNGAISGELRTPTSSTPFTATVAAEPAGVYEARIPVDGSQARIGWAVLPDGSQVGVLAVGDTRRGAPTLDLADLTFEHDGRLFTAWRAGP